MTAKELAGELRRAGFRGVDVPCGEHPEEPARFFCPRCRRACCLPCGALKRGALTCEPCAGRSPRRRFGALRSPAVASAAAVLVLTVLVVAFGDAFRPEPRSVSYSTAGEPPAVSRAMRTLHQAHRLRTTADLYALHGEAERAARFRRWALERYAAFETSYPADDRDVTASYATAASRFARAGSTAEFETLAKEFPDEPAGTLAAVRAAWTKLDAGLDEETLKRLRDAVARVGDVVDQLAKAFASQHAAMRRLAIETYTGTRFSKAALDLEVSYLQGRVHEAAGRKEAAVAEYSRVAAATWLKASWCDDARERLGRLQASTETIHVERFNP